MTRRYVDHSQHAESRRHAEMMAKDQKKLAALGRRIEQVRAKRRQPTEAEARALFAGFRP